MRTSYQAPLEGREGFWRLFLPWRLFQPVEAVLASLSYQAGAGPPGCMAAPPLHPTSDLAEAGRDRSIVRRSIEWERVPFKRTLSPLPLVRRGWRERTLLRVRLRAALHEVIDRCVGLITIEHPRRTLRLDRARERCAQIRTNELTAHAEHRRDRFRPVRRTLIDRRAIVLRCHDYPPLVAFAVHRDSMNDRTIDCKSACLSFVHCLVASIIVRPCRTPFDVAHRDNDPPPPPPPEGGIAKLRPSRAERQRAGCVRFGAGESHVCGMRKEEGFDASPLCTPSPA